MNAGLRENVERSAGLFPLGHFLKPSRESVAAGGRVGWQKKKNKKMAMHHGNSRRSWYDCARLAVFSVLPANGSARGTGHRAKEPITAMANH